MHGRSRRGSLPDLTRFDTQSFIYGSDDAPLCAAIVVRIATFTTVFTTWFGQILLVTGQDYSCLIGDGSNHYDGFLGH